MRLFYLALLAASVSLGAPAHASGVAFNAYLGIPLDGNTPFFGTTWGPDRVTPLGADNTSAPMPQPAFDLRYGGQKDSVLSINGIPILRTVRRHSPDNGEPEQTASAKEDIDWYLVAGVVLGAGLVAALVAADDVSVKACSGPNCPPVQAPPPEQPKPTQSSQGQ